MANILHKYITKLAESDYKYQDVTSIDLLHKNHHQELVKGCEKFTKELENINSHNISFSQIFPDNIDTFIGKNKTFYYTGCSEFKTFINKFNKQANVKIEHDDNLFVNKIHVDKDELKKNKVVYVLEYEAVLNVGKLPTTPNEKNTFLL